MLATPRHRGEQSRQKEFTRIPPYKDRVGQKVELRRRQGGESWTREEMWAGLGRRLRGTRVQGQKGRQCEEVLEPVP